MHYIGDPESGNFIQMVLDVFKVEIYDTNVDSETYKPYCGDEFNGIRI